MILPIIFSLALGQFQGVNTPDEAAKEVYAFIEKYFPKYTDIEYGGTIYLNNGKYYPTIPIQGETTAVHIRFNPNKGKLVAIYHTHPRKPQYRWFSHTDIDSADRLKINSYLLDPWGQIKVYNAISHKVKDLQ